MSRVRQNISFSLGVSNQVLSQYLWLAQHFHCKKFPCCKFSHEVDLSERSTAKHFKRHEIIRTYLVWHNAHSWTAEFLLERLSQPVVQVSLTFKESWTRCFRNAVVDLYIFVFSAALQSLIINRNFFLLNLSILRRATWLLGGIVCVFRRKRLWLLKITHCFVLLRFFRLVRLTTRSTTSTAASSTT